MKMTRRNFLSTSAVAALACGASLTAHAAGSTDENSLNFITDIFKDPTQPGEIEEATAITAEKNAEWYEKLDFSDRRELDNAARGLLDNQEGRVIYNDDGTTAMGIWTVMRRIRSTRACGGIPSSMPKPVCLKYVTASIRCVALIWPMRPSSAPTTAGSFLMS